MGPKIQRDEAFRADADDALLRHLVSNIIPLIFPMLRAGQNCVSWREYIIPAEGCYLNFCLSIANQHRYTVREYRHGDGDLLRRRDEAISAVRNSLQREALRPQSLQTALAVIYFQRLVQPLRGSLSHIAWREHLKFAVWSAQQQLYLPNLASELHWSIALAAWADIIGSAIQGIAPVLVIMDRERLCSLSSWPCKIRQLTGCADSVMYLIADIACLESKKREGDLKECQLRKQISCIAEQITHAYLPVGRHDILDPPELSRYITAAFKYAAHIYLHTLNPGFSPHEQGCVGLVSSLTSTLEQIPAGAAGYDRGLMWVYLICGSVSVTSSPFRVFFETRVSQLGNESFRGSFGYLYCLLNEVWKRIDRQGAKQRYVCWRRVMAENGWNFSMI